MLNRVIYDGKVYYTVNDLRVLFDLSKYKLKKALNAQNIKQTTLLGFGRALFVSEENVAKIEVNDEFTIIQTIFEESIDKKAVEKTDEAPVKTQVKKSKKKSKKKKDVKKPVSDKKVEPNTEIDRTQSELETSIKLGNHYALKFIKAGKAPLAYEISDKHLGKGKLLQDATKDDMEKVRSLIAELTIEVAKLDIPLAS